MPYSAYPYQLRELAAPSAPNSHYRTIHPQPAARSHEGAPIMGRRDVVGNRVRAVPSTATTGHGVPFHISSALASWSIPPESWIHYYNGTYAWPAGPVIQDPRVLRLEQSFVPTTAFLPQFTSNTATSPPPPPNNTSSHLANGRQQIRRAPRNCSEYLRDQYAVGSLPRPIGPQDTRPYGFDGSEEDSSPRPNFGFSEEDMCPPPGFDDPKSTDDKLTDLRAIVNFIVPAGGLDPDLNYGVLECLKYTPSDVDEGIEHFVHNAEAKDPGFHSKLAELSNDRPGVFRGASPTDDWRKKEMYAWGYIHYQGQWTKIQDIGKRRREIQDAERNAQQQQQQQAVYANRTQPHPAQLEDELEYQAQYRHVVVDDDYTRDFEGDFDDDFHLVGAMKGGVSKKGSPKWLKGSGTIRRRSSSSSKSKRETKQQKMDRGSKEDDHRSCFDLS